MTSLGDVYLDVHGNTKPLHEDVKGVGKQVGGEGDKAGEQFSRGFDRGFSRGYRRSGVFRNFLRFLGLPFRVAIKGFTETGKAMAKVFTNLGEGASAAAKLGAVFKALGIGVLGVGKTFLKSGIAMAAILLLIGPLAAGLSLLIGVATALASAVGFALVGAIGALVAIIGPAVAGLGVLGLAFIGMSDKAKKAVKEAFQPLKNEFRDLSKAARGPLLDAIPQMAKNLEGPLKNLRPLVRGISEAVGDVGISFAQGLKTQGFKDFRDSMETFLPGAIRRLGDIARQTLGGFGGIFRGMIPFMRDVLGWLDNLTARFSEWANSTVGQTAIEGFFRRVQTSLKSVGGFLKEVGGLIGDILGMGRGAGNTLFDDMAEGARKLRQYFADNPDALRQWFRDAVKFGRQLGDMVVAAGKLWDALDNAGTRFVVGAGIKAFAGLLEGMADTAKFIHDTLNLIPGLDLGTPAGGESELDSWTSSLRDMVKWVPLVGGYADDLLGKLEALGGTKPKGDPGGLKTIGADAKNSKKEVEDLFKLMTAGIPKPPSKGGHPSRGAGGFGPDHAAIKNIIDQYQAMGQMPILKPKVDPSAIKELIRLSGQSARLLFRIGEIPPLRPKADPAEIMKLSRATGLGIKELGKLGAFKNIRPTADPSRIQNLMRVTGLSRKELVKLGLVKAKPKIDVQSDAEKEAAAARRAIASVKSKKVYIDTIFRRGKGAANPTINSENWMGGPVKGYARGGLLGGTPPSNPRKDNLFGLVDGGKLIGLRSGEFVMNEPATKIWGPLFEAMNQAAMGKGSSVGLPSRAEGGSASPAINIPADLGRMTDSQMRRQAEFFADALAKKGLRLVDRSGNIQQLAVGG